MKSNITIRIGASHDEVTVDGHVFDRSVMNKGQKRKLARMITAGKRKEQGA